MKIIALIPARGGSKRLPGKNILPFNDKPLVSYSIKAALEANQVNAVYVSTDSKEIADVAAQFGANIIDRPQEFANDFASTSDVLIHASEVLNLSDEDIIITLQATNPLRPNGLIDELVEFAKNKGHWDSILTLSEIPLKFGVVKDGEYNPVNYKEGQRSQDMDSKYYFENGLVYLTRVATLKKYASMFGESKLGFETEYDYSRIDIDTKEDFVIGEISYRELKSKYRLV